MSPEKNSKKPVLNKKPENKAAKQQSILVAAALSAMTDFSPRVREIISSRFGMQVKEPQTLEEIGKKYGITRERVRQIIREALKKMRQKRNGNESIQKMQNQVEFTLNKNSGIMKREALLSSVAGADAREQGAVRFFMHCIDGVTLSEKRSDLEPSYMLSGFSLERWGEVEKKAAEILAKKNEPMAVSEIFQKIGDSGPIGISEETLGHWLAVSMKINKNSFSKWGLSAWTQINPKGAREKAFAVLQEMKKPLHFREIAGMIDKYYQGRKKTHPQTVHNELIKDSRFVLIGRGIYALGLWGYKRGTVKDVLEVILKKSGAPLGRKEIIDEIMKVRQVKKSTVMINLNNFFSRVGKDLYTLKK